ncbi:MAG: hypothetical protein FJ125_06375, partial [Deltaproteobacteria bacterium]|nr:hypothetical protein [Deltaproteobacteria bacterium]
DPDEQVRWAAARSLGQGGEQALQQLVQSSRSPDDGMREQAVRGLGRLGRREALDALIDALSDPLHTVRRAAEEALIALGWHPVGWRQRRTDRSYLRWTRRAEWLGDDPDADQLTLLVAALASPDADRRRNAAEALGLCGDTGAVEPLRRLLVDDPDRDVRIVAAESLELLGEPPRQVLPWLPYWVAWEHWDACVAFGEAAVSELSAVLGSIDERSRAGAIRALGRIPGLAAQQALLVATGDPLERLRLAALAALRARPVGELVQALPRLLPLLEDEGLAGEVVSLLVEELEEEVALPLLAELVESGSAASCSRAVEALGRLQGSAAATALLRRALDRPESAVRVAALRALGRTGDPSLGGQLLELLRGEPDAAIRAAAAGALGGLAGSGRDADAAVLVALIEGLGDGYAEVRRGCRRTLETLGRLPADEVLEASEAIGLEQWSRVAAIGPPAVPLLLHVLADPQSDPLADHWRSAAARTLGTIGDLRALDSLLALLDHAHPRLRATAAAALGDLGDPRAAGALAALFDRSPLEPEVRLAVVRSLPRLEAAVAAPVLARALSDADPQVRAAAAAALGESPVSQADLLIDALQSPDAEVRRGAALELGRLGETKAIDPLIGVLVDISLAVRTAARQSLLALGWHPVGWRASPDARGYAYWTLRAEWLGSDPDEPQASLLLRGLSEGDPDRRRNAAEALGLLGDPAALGALHFTVASDADAAVRTVAADAVALLEEVCRRQDEAARELLAQAAAAGRTVAAWPLLGEGADPTADDASHQATAALALGLAGDRAAVGQLVRALEHPRAEVRAAALRSLDRLGGEQAQQALAACLSRPELSPLAAAALARTGPAGVARLAGALAGDGPEAMRRSAAAGLGLSGDTAAVAPLVAALAAPGEGVRLAAATGLAMLGERAQQAAGRLRSLLAATPGPALRAALACALGRLGEPTAAAELRLGLADPEAEVRSACLDGLEALGQPASEELRQASLAIARGGWAEAAALGSPASELLLHMLAAPERETVSRRGGAAWALASMGEARAEQPLLDALEEEEPELVAA